MTSVLGFPENAPHLQFNESNSQLSRLLDTVSGFNLLVNYLNHFLFFYDARAQLIVFASPFVMFSP